MSELAEALGDIRALRQRVAALEAQVRHLSNAWRHAMGVMSPAPAAPEPERADACERALDAYAKSLNLGLYPAEKAAFRAGYRAALAATAERDAEVRAVLTWIAESGSAPWEARRAREALRLLGGGTP